MEEEKKWNYLYKRFIWSEILYLVLSIIALIISIIEVYSILTDNDTLFCEKTTIQNQLKTIIKNGGDLDAVKDAYNDRDLKSISFRFSRLEIKDYYKEDVPLSVVLKNLRTRYYLEKEQRRYSYKTHVIKDSILVDADSLYFSLLNKIIDEYNKKNPFDKLEPNQRDLFISLQQKLDTGYVKVSGDITKVVDEMDNKNQLVTKYLNKSDMSFYISIFALGVTFLFGSYQIHQNRKSSNQLKKHLDEIEKKINDKE